ncbi:unnamed protein product [Amaranthus hypochondriacus]
MFPKKDTPFYLIGHYLFNPSNEAWALITKFYQAYLAKSDKKIGIQIRVFGLQKIPIDDIMSQILNCTQEHNILPRFENDTKSSSHNLAFESSVPQSKSVLVTSLYPEFAEELKSMYWTKPVVNGDVIGFHQPSHEVKQKFHDNMHNMKALAEIYLLSLCDVILTSPQSTFGYVAQSLGALKPWVMVRLGYRSGHLDPACRRDFSMEPCFHIPPQYDCKDKTKINNFTNFYPNVKVCEDVNYGIKLFNT